MSQPVKPVVDDSQARMWSMLVHLSIFAGYVVPLAGLIAPIVIWQMKKDEFPVVDAHGKMVVNFIITVVILAAIFTVLMFVLIGIPLLIALGIVGIIFPIIGAIKANNGEFWKYPGVFPFLK
jgi:uncharacterized Tic20 family protein